MFSDEISPLFYMSNNVNMHINRPVFSISQKFILTMPLTALTSLHFYIMHQNQNKWRYVTLSEAEELRRSISTRSPRAGPEGVSRPTTDRAISSPTDLTQSNSSQSAWILQSREEVSASPNVLHEELTCNSNPTSLCRTIGLRSIVLQLFGRLSPCPPFLFYPLH